MPVAPEASAPAAWSLSFDVVSAAVCSDCLPSVFDLTIPDCAGAAMFAVPALCLFCYGGFALVSTAAGSRVLASEVGADSGGGEAKVTALNSFLSGSAVASTGVGSCTAGDSARVWIEAGEGVAVATAGAVF